MLLVTRSNGEQEDYGSQLGVTLDRRTIPDRQTTKVQDIDEHAPCLRAGGMAERDLQERIKGPLQLNGLGD